MVSLSSSAMKNWSPKTFLLLQLYLFGSTASVSAGGSAGVDFLQPLNTTRPTSNMLTNAIIVQTLPFIFVSP
jgi:hypothetical protein